MPRIRPDGGAHGSVVTPTLSAASGMWSLKDLERSSRAGIWPPPAALNPPDANFKYVSLLFHADGTNGANNTVFVDSSVNSYTLTTNGRPTQGTFTPFSLTGWSAAFNLSGNTDNIATTNFDASLTPGTNDYTIEFWVYPTATTGRQNWFNLQASAGFNRILVYYTGTAISLDIGAASAAATKISYTVALSSIAFRWNHIAVSRVSGTTRMFLNGVQIGVDYVASDNFTAAFKMTTMKDPGGTTWGSGYLSNMRYIIGTGLYTTTFTPSTSALSSTGSGTRLLTFQEFRFRDTGANTQALTFTGTPAITPASPFSPANAYSTSTVGGSILFNGSTDYLSLTSTFPGVGTNNFTVEFWIYKNNAWGTGDQYIIDGGVSSAMQVWINTAAGALRLGRYGVDVILDYAYSSLTAKQWYHVAYVRSGTTLSLFINGTRVATTTSSASFAATSATQNIGRGTGGTGFLNAYVSGLRVVNNSAIYDPTLATLTVPTSPSTAIANTTLLLSATNAGIIDQTTKTTLTTYGSAAISSVKSKFGDKSIYYNGSTDYIQGTVPAPGTGDFTLEGWVNFSAVPATGASPTFFSIIGTSSSNGFQPYATTSGWGIRNNTQNILGAAGGAGIGTAPTIGTWYHVAIVRYSGTTSMYIDGVSAGSTATAYTFSDTTFSSGWCATGSTGVYFNGYVDDVRYTAGLARYTGNFTPPTSAFADQ